jgi:glutaredoxin
MIELYGADWCGDCIRSKRLLTTLGVDFAYLEVDKDDALRDRAIAINGGAQSIPVIVFSDGTHLTEPPDPQLREKLAGLGLIVG